MEPSHSETCSDEHEVIETVSITTDEYNELTTSLNWHAAVLAVLLEEAGGAVEVKKEDLTSVDLSQARVAISYIEHTDTYLFERVFPADES